MCSNPCFLCGDIDECKVYKEYYKKIEKFLKKSPYYEVLWKDFLKYVKEKNNAICKK